MGNIEINAGGFIGALLALGIGIAVLVVMFSDDVDSMGSGPAKLVVFGVIAGAIAGNFLWAKFVKKNDGDSNGSNREQ